ncbi:Gfo/Idh/MocA family oxidoreductase [Ferrovibrio terrae]|uniref:Gfo/Idh/MocA family oxidoreductase n=1 Tax=Ferrovibrio terrae TaxID=2594003 RepID=UPI003138059C
MLRLGVIGLSAGNGHPYSWSAICNGYDPVAMARCPFPAIPAYLAERAWPQDRLQGAVVTHVWTQDATLSAEIAAATHIATVVHDWRDMLGTVDGILLARDDAENHAGFALPILEAGLPVYIDKPLALNLGAADHLLGAERWPGQIFAGSALSHAEELQLTGTQRAALGAIRHVEAATPKYWPTYAVHLIEPALAILEQDAFPSATTVLHSEDRTMATASFPDGTSLGLACLGSLPSPIAFRIFGSAGMIELRFRDSFTAFRTALQRFVDGVRLRRRMFDANRIRISAALIEAGMA